MKQFLYIAGVVILASLLFSCSKTIAASGARSNHDRHNANSGYNHLKNPKKGECYTQCIWPEEGEVRWTQIICDKDMTDKFIRSLAIALNEKGYLEAEEVNPIWNEKKKMAAKKYQEDHKLPVGALNILTLKSLDVQY